MPAATPLPSSTFPLPRALKGVRVLSLALNLPGPAALMRCVAMGARCTKWEPLAAAGSEGTADPMGQYNRGAYDTMHHGVQVRQADLKSAQGQAALHRALARTDVLLTSFRPSALAKLGLGWKVLRASHPQLSLVAIVGAPGTRAEEPGHDLTYMAESGLVPGLDLPPTLYADMAGSLMASEAVLQATLLQRAKGRGVRMEVALSEAARYLGLPRQWGLTTPGAAVGGGHAGYRVYACADGRVALAALEPHFAARLGAQAGLAQSHIFAMFDPANHRAVAQWCLRHSRAELDAVALAHDIPLFTMA